MKTLVDVYFDALNVHQNLYVSKHVIERCIERKIAIEELVKFIKTFAIPNICVLIYECVLNGGRTVVKFGNVRIPVSFSEQSMTLTLRTIY